MSGPDMQSRVATLNAEYARCIDDDRLEEWPGFFPEKCLCKITTAENLAKGYEAGLVYADSQGMLRDRVSALREANIYERQRYRHIVGLPFVVGEDNGGTRVETPFLIVRIMRDGTMEVFATGCYHDRVAADPAGALKFAERIVVCDGSRFDTLVAIPF